HQRLALDLDRGRGRVARLRGRRRGRGAGPAAAVVALHAGQHDALVGAVRGRRLRHGRLVVGASGAAAEQGHTGAEGEPDLVPAHDGRTSAGVRAYTPARIRSRGLPGHHVLEVEVALGVVELAAELVALHLDEQEAGLAGVLEAGRVAPVPDLGGLGAGAADDELGAAQGVRLVEPLAAVVVAGQHHVRRAAHHLLEERLDLAA